MPAQIIAKLGGDFFLQGFDFGVDEFDHVTGLDIDKMVVVFACRVFVAGAAIAKFQTLQNTGFLEQLYRTIDRCQRYSAVDRTGPRIKFFDIGVIAAVLQHLGNHAALARNAKALGLATIDDCLRHGSSRLLS